MLTEALIYGSIALVLSASARAFGTLNLAAGTWVTIGGWLGLSAMAIVGRQPLTALNLVGLLPLSAVALLQAGSALVLRRNVLERPLAFLLVTLGCHRAADAISSRWFVASWQSRIPPNALPDWVCWLGISVIVGSAIWAKNSGWFSRIALRARVSDNSSPVWRLVSMVLLLEIGLLLLVGVFAGPTLHGIPGNEFLTIVPVLAVCATRFDAGRAFVISAAALVVMRFVEGSFLHVGTAASSVVLLLLGTFVTVRYWPTGLITGSRLVETVFPAWPGWPFGRGARPANRSLLTHPALAVMFGAAVLGWILLSAAPTAHGLVRGLFVLALTLCAAQSARILGVRSIAWPLLAAAGPLAVARSAGPESVILFALLVVTIWSVYALALRALPTASALVIDLAATVSVVQLATSHSVFGSEGARQFAALGATWSLAVVASVLAGIVGILWTGIPWLARGQRGRATILGLVNLANGENHGQRTITALVAGSGTLALAAMFAGIAFSADAAVLSDRDISVGLGLLILLVSSVLSTIPFVLGASGVVFLSAFIERWLAGKGVLLDLAIGLLLAVFALTTNRRLKEP
ncbi:MAG: hypothetical protein Q7S20_11795 [Gemmatimonadaceae bacterium]|nr:hypothetical protein [Gemmatimonadaceae bacterium]